MSRNTPLPAFSLHTSEVFDSEKTLIAINCTVVLPTASYVSWQELVRYPKGADAQVCIDSAWESVMRSYRRAQRDYHELQEMMRHR